MNTKVWTNAQNGHHFADGPGGMTVNGKAVSGIPEWADGRAPDMVFGPMIEWGGGDCPVDPDTYVRCIFRGRRPYLRQAIYPGLSQDAKRAMWMHAPFLTRNDPNMDIIGYQVRLS